MKNIQVVTAYRQFKECERQIEETKGLASFNFFLELITRCSQFIFVSTNMIALQKENGDDPDMAEMIASELESLSNELAELEEKLTVGRADIFDLDLLKYFSLLLTISC